jgi:hypothetical protein
VSEDTDFGDGSLTMITLEVQLGRLLGYAVGSQLGYDALRTPDGRPAVAPEATVTYNLRTSAFTAASMTVRLHSGGSDRMFPAYFQLLPANSQLPHATVFVPQRPF